MFKLDWKILERMKMNFYQKDEQITFSWKWCNLLIENFLCFLELFWKALVQVLEELMISLTLNYTTFKSFHKILSWVFKLHIVMLVFNYLVLKLVWSIKKVLEHHFKVLQSLTHQSSIKLRQASLSRHINFSNQFIQL